MIDDPVWRELVELWQVTVRQARAETTPVPDNSPFRSQALQTSAGPRQHPTPASSGQHPSPRPPLAPGDARFGPEPPRPSDSAGFGMESPRSNPSPSNEGSPKNRSIIGGPSPCLLVPISYSRHSKDLPLEPPFRAFPTHTSQWLFGDWGVRDGAREPGPASGVADPRAQRGPGRGGCKCHPF